jgi:hypothetical protein
VGRKERWRFSAGNSLRPVLSDTPLRQSHYMGRPKCTNAGNGCKGRADSRRKTHPELCKECIKSAQLRKFTHVAGRKRWAKMCANANTSAGTILRCRGHLHQREEQRKLCARCFMETKEGRTDLQKKRALEKRERRQRNNMQKDTEAPVATKQHKRNKMLPETEPDMIKLHVVTVKPLRRVI